MPLSKRQLEQISEIISRRFNTFAYEALGERALTPDELRTLIEAGVVRSTVRHLIMDPVILGRITALLPLSARKGVTYGHVERAASHVEMTPVERASIDFATDHAGEHIKGIRDMIVRDVKAITARGSEAALRAVQENVAGSIEARTTISELKTALFDAIDNRTRDWHRIAHTEINSAVQQGVYRSIRDASDDGKDQVVYKLPNPGACVHCKRVYLKPDGTPRVFKLSELEDSNVGLKAADWGPVIGSVHPWCFPAGHMVTTLQGQKSIETVTLEDRVLTHKGRFKKVTKLFKRGFSGELVIVRAGGRTIESTPNHPFLRNNEWVSASELREGDNLSEVIPSKIVFEKVDNKPAALGEVRDFIGVLLSFLFGAVPIAALNLYRNLFVRNRNVDVVLKDGVERADNKSFRLEGINKFQFKIRKRLALLGGDGFKDKRLILHLRAFPYFVGIFCQSLLIGIRHCFIFEKGCLAGASNGYPHVIHPAYDGPSRDPKYFRHHKDTDSLGMHFSKGDFNVSHGHGNSSFKRVVIVNLAKRPYIGSVFNIGVEGDNSYVCEGIVVHNCNCQLIVIPEGFDFAKTRVVIDPFTDSDGYEWKRGEIVDAPSYDKLDSNQKTHIGADSVLVYTGKTASPEVEKSFFKRSAIDDDCLCEHD